MKHMREMCILSPHTLVLISLVILRLPVSAMDLLVSNAADAGSGSLRQAVNDNNASGGAFSNQVVTC